ncbi:reactive intermediate/imine deaminase [Paraburkholderia atlantica]|uniref:Reactive intermediate/imine deaminase n=1 Tax=Paraburkholderia atlantica TaxID=2654982 RepID=A0A6I1Q4K6_PARAM|nr:RidA family protein [Paraburkholderia atlantica]MBB5420788.1 reactive intermediate/imine deaminase [Paraburkholderia atlantica]MBB5428268.1 reactive intermediate/imine deaminase [Paraburkholderia atlantica]MPW09404.1 RidA family protein [Paraburkholderia atlantica]NUY33001.1 RidA family protein [Paraburkholderia atlantica]
MTDSTHAPRLPHTDNPAALAKPGGHYSHVAVANGFVFVSGQLPINAQGDKLADASFDAQAEQVLANVKAALESVGSSVAQLVQVRVYVVDVEHWASFDQIYARWAGEAKPARAVVPVPQLHYGFKIEVEAVGVV